MPLRHLGAFFLVLLFAACQSEPSSRPPTEAKTTSPERLIALAPNLVETVHDLGIGDRLVGVGDYAMWPPEVEHLPRLGGLIDPHIEEIIALAPDLAILLPGEAELGRKLHALGIETLIVPSDSLDDVGASFEIIANRCDVAAAGIEAADRWRRGIEREPVQGGARVLLVAGRTPGAIRDIYVAGPGTFLSELVSRLGAENIFADLAIAYPKVGLDAIVARRPDIILELNGKSLTDAEVAGLVEDWEGLFHEPPRVQVISGDHVLIPGPRIPLLVDELIQALGNRK